MYTLIPSLVFQPPSGLFFSARNVVCVSFHHNNFFNCLAALHPLGLDFRDHPSGILRIILPPSKKPALTPSINLRLEFIPFPLTFVKILCISLLHNICLHPILPNQTVSNLKPELCLTPSLNSQFLAQCLAHLRLLTVQ